MKRVKAEMEIRPGKNGIFYYSVWVDFNPESDERAQRVLIVGG